MAITVKHKFVSAIPDGADATVVRPSNWNDDHDLTGTIPVANGGTGASTADGAVTNLLPSQTGNNGKVLTTDGTNTSWSANGVGDVVGPASATDNAVARFDTTTGKLIQNSVTLIDDTGNASGILSQQFSNGSAVTLAAGKLWYDGATGAWNAGMGNGNITQQIGEELFVYGKASAAITDSPLQIIYQTGTVGASGVITFAPTIAGLTDGFTIIGVATESLALNAFGRATSYGVVRGITTNGTAFGETWADGDEIWYNPVTGNPTKVKPVAPNIKVSVGTIIKAGAGGSGSIQVEIAHGSVLGGTDSNVQLTSPTAAQILTYDSGNAYWKNTSLAAGTGISIGTNTNGTLTVTNTSPSSGGTVTSVAATVPALFSISGSPITSSGTLAMTYSGTALPAANGGTGQTSYAVGDIVYASTTTALSKLADVATGNALISGGVGVAPSYGKIGLTTHVSGTLPIANGGTNATTASITSFNNITGYTASGATGTTSTNLVFSTAPTVTNPTLTGFIETVYAATGTTPALSPTNGTIQTWTLSGSSTPTAGTWTAGASMTLQIVASTYTVTWTSLAVSWIGGSAPTLSTSGTTVIELWKVGSTIYGALVGSV